jgi:hypothetical protein
MAFLHGKLVSAIDTRSPFQILRVAVTERHVASNYMTHAPCTRKSIPDSRSRQVLRIDNSSIAR